MFSVLNMLAVPVSGDSPLSGAVTAAAALVGTLSGFGSWMSVVLSGGNVDPLILPRVLTVDYGATSSCGSHMVEQGCIKV